MNRGVYLAFFRLPRTQTIEIGRLGCWRFAAGVYVYVGSAQRNLQARLGRHARRHKTRCWHIDYVSVRADFLGRDDRRSQEQRMPAGGDAGEAVSAGGGGVRGVGLPVRGASVPGGGWWGGRQECGGAAARGTGRLGGGQGAACDSGGHGLGRGCHGGARVGRVSGGRGVICATRQHWI